MNLPIIKTVFAPGKIADNLLVTMVDSPGTQMHGFYWREVHIPHDPTYKPTFDRSFGPFPDLQDCMRHYGNLYKAIKRIPARWPIYRNNVINVDFVKKERL